MIFYAVGLIHVEEIYQLTLNSSYCKPFQNNAFVVHDYECPCAHSIANQTSMAANVEFYNQALKSVYLTYAAQNFPTFGVAYQPLPVNIMSFPIQAISNIEQIFFNRLFSSSTDGTRMASENDMVR
ncbi:hypothetical protein INT44_001838, partial [Umbelopsis vinacea]